MAKVGSGPNLNQGEGGAKKGSSGSHLEQGSTGATKKGPSGSHLDQNPNVKAGPQGGSHLDQHPSNQRGKQAPQRGGHSRDGYGNHERTSKSGSKNAQNPGFYK